MRSCLPFLKLGKNFPSQTFCQYVNIVLVGYYNSNFLWSVLVDDEW